MIQLTDPIWCYLATMIYTKSMIDVFVKYLTWFHSASIEEGFAGHDINSFTPGRF